MSQIDDLVSQLNRAKYVYLRHISEPRDNSLRIVVEEALGIQDPKTSRALAEKLPEIAGILTSSRVIKSNNACKKFELRWDTYVAYLVTEEMVGSCGSHDAELFTGNLFRLYTQSHFLDHLLRDTGCHENRPIHHYKLICLNHLIDVASYAPPDIELLRAASETRRIP